MSNLIEENERLIFADKGFNIYSEGESSSDELFSVIHALEDSVIEIGFVVNSIPVTSLTLIAGMPLYGTFKNLTVTSGKVIAYKR